MKLHIEQNEDGAAGSAVESVVIFAIDNGHDPRIRARFERHLDTVRAMGQMKRPVRLCMGMWKGKIEASYEMVRSDFEQHVMRYGWVRQQAAILGVVAGRAVLIDWYGKVSEAGSWHKVEAMYAPFCDGWTYYLDTNEYWVAE